MRTILLKIECKGGAGGCCGKSGGKPSYKHALLRIEEGFASVRIDESDGWQAPEHLCWKLIEASPLYGNILIMAKKHATEKPAWAGTVLTLGLDKDEDFMAQLNALKIIKKGCVIVE